MANNNTDAATVSSRYATANRWLHMALNGVTMYACGMVVAGRQVATPLFDALNFGPHSRGLEEKGIRYALFAFGILGAVLLGWMVLMGFVAELAIHRDPTVRSLARKALIVSTAVWFTFDTGFSLVTGETEHALFNVSFLALIGGPLYVMSVNDGDSPVGKGQ